MKTYQWAYHTTSLENIASIEKKGLCIIPGCWDRIWFTNVPYGYLPFKNLGNQVQLRFSWPKDAVFDNNTDCREYYTKTMLYPSQLEICVDGIKWVPLHTWNKNSKPFQVYYAF